MNWAAEQRAFDRNERAGIDRDIAAGRYNGFTPVEAYKVRDAMGRERWEERPAPPVPERLGQYDPDLDGSAEIG